MPKYSLSPDGNILADNQTIGHLHGDHGEYSVEIKLATSALNTIKALIFDRMMARAAPRTFDKVEQPEATQDIVSRDEYASYQPPPAPDPPPMDPRLGDKTPAYMAWFSTYFPDKYREKYKGRRTHLTTGMNPHLAPAGDVPETHFAREDSEVWMKKR